MISSETRQSLVSDELFGPQVGFPCPTTMHMKDTLNLIYQPEGNIKIDQQLDERKMKSLLCYSDVIMLCNDSAY